MIFFKNVTLCPQRVGNDSCFLIVVCLPDPNQEKIFYVFLTAVELRF